MATSSLGAGLRNRKVQLVVLVIVIVVALVGGILVATRHHHIVNPSTLSRFEQSDFVHLRVVLCSVPSYQRQSTPDTAALPPTCPAASAMTAQNLNIQLAPNAPTGYTVTSVPADTALSTHPSTRRSLQYADRPILTREIDGGRYLLGPTLMTLASPTEVKSAEAVPLDGHWVIDYVLTTVGAQQFVAAAQQHFHEELAFTYKGRIFSAPLIQPTQSAFSSFSADGEISGHLTKALATSLAHAMN